MSPRRKLHQRLQRPNQPIWEQENRELRQRIEELRNEAYAYRQTIIDQIKRIEELEQRADITTKGGHWVTNEQIGAAWKRILDINVHYQGAGWDALEKLNIVRCERCAKLIHRVSHGGLPGVDDICPDCNGKGWVIGGEDE
jgi:type I site-specific restriction-modification system R (restriction) subunit